MILHSALSIAVAPAHRTSDIPDDVPAEVKKRLSILQGRIAGMAMEISQNMVGNTENILVTGSPKRTLDNLIRTEENNRVVNFRCDDANPVRHFTDVLIQEGIAQLTARHFGRPFNKTLIQQMVGLF